jgi:hypothetical protein
MYSLVTHLNIFPIGFNVNLSCGGGHLGFLIGIKKNLNIVEDLPVINGSLIHNVNISKGISSVVTIPP